MLFDERAVLVLARDPQRHVRAQFPARDACRKLLQRFQVDADILLLRPDGQREKKKQKINLKTLNT